MLVNRPVVDVALHSDSICTVMRANGQWQLAAADTLANTCRNIAQAIDCLRRVRPFDILHVRGHGGNPWNELADSLAKHALHAECTVLHGEAISEWVRECSLDNLWLLLSAFLEPGLWPQHNGSHMVDTGMVLPAAMPPVGEVLQSRTAPLEVSARWHALRVATLNVQTMAEGTEESQANYAGRAAFLRDQFASLGVHVVGIQEARTDKASSFISGNFIRICSGATAAGQLGVEAWFCRSSESGSVGFHVDELIVTHWDPRLLCVKVSSVFLNATVVVAHAPTATDPNRGSWWQAFQDLLRRITADSPVCILGDLNARLVEPLAQRVGDFVFPSSHRPPTQLASILVEQDLWAPSTFPGIHVGQHETWCAPGSTCMARIDFILIPCNWVVGENASWVSLDIDPGHKSIDHFPVLLDFWTCEKGKVAGKGKRRGFDRQAMTSSSGKGKLRAICRNLPLQPWSMDSDTHYAVLQRHIVKELQVAFPPPRAQRASSFLTLSTWMLKDHRTWLRRQTFVCKKRARFPWMWIALRVWKLGVRWWIGLSSVAVRLCAGLRDTSQFVSDLRSSRQELRRAVRRDRRNWLQELAEKALDLPVRDVIRQLRPLLRTLGKRHTARKAIPAVMLEDGTLASTPASAIARWVRHFAAVEGGSDSTFEQLWHDKRERLQLFAVEPFHIN